MFIIMQLMSMLSHDTTSYMISIQLYVCSTSVQSTYLTDAIWYNIVRRRYAPIVAPFADWTRSPALFDTPSDRPLPARHRSPRRSSN